MKTNSHFSRQLIRSLFIIVALTMLSACTPGKVKLNCLEEKCTGEVTLAILDYSTAKCEANGQKCEFRMPANHSFKTHSVSGVGCANPARCGKGDTCSVALAQKIKNAKWDLENERKNLLAGSNNRCVVAPSPSHFVCTWTDPKPLPDAKFTPDTPKATPTKKKCKCP